jgi:hypothetical protein
MKILFYLQLAWHWLAYIATVVEPERLQSNLGVTYFNLGDFRRAITHLEKSERVRHSKDSSFGRYNAYYLGFSYMNLGITVRPLLTLKSTCAFVRKTRTRKKLLTGVTSS